jgi:hypothetical protein
VSVKLQVVIACLVAAVASPLVTAEELSQAEFEKLHAELSPERAAWEAVPWQLSITDACSLAAKEHKPVYMLVRSGHPLGCV